MGGVRHGRFLERPISGYNTKTEAEVALENFKANMKSHGIEFAIDTIKREHIRNR